MQARRKNERSLVRMYATSYLYASFFGMGEPGLPQIIRKVRMNGVKNLELEPSIFKLESRRKL